MHYIELDPVLSDPKRIKRERDKARQLKKSHWWAEKLQEGACHYCGERFSPEQLTMDHVVPLARGGFSNKGNLVPACPRCNQNKKLATPAELLMS